MGGGITGQIWMYISLNRKHFKSSQGLLSLTLPLLFLMKLVAWQCRDVPPLLGLTLLT